MKKSSVVILSSLALIPVLCVCIVVAGFFLLPSTVKTTDNVKTQQQVTITPKSDYVKQDWSALGGLICILPVLTFNALLAIVVLNDAQKNNIKNAKLWALFTVITGLLMLVYYFVMRSSLQKNSIVNTKNKK